MDYKKIVTGQLEVNTYIISHINGDCLVFDPSDSCGDVVKYLKKEKLRPISILLTHGHFDHIMGIPDILAEYKEVNIRIHDDDRDMLSDSNRNGSVLMGADFAVDSGIEPLTEGAARIGEFEFTVLHVPGHTRGGCAFVFDNVCFCGDTVFAGSVGRTDLPGGDSRQLLASIREKILTLPPRTILCPGHGGRTTVERESLINPFLRGL
ncbi:MAG: MBL fold metallo-hydrolase [Chitinispirillales bacterium]|jgi:glyoxylase-like metal-dependent hydrolase (beta-lactamase superfamily II)|nr:MBL fold metallo-hydrolase [Chitinispirillales bacterium]